MPDERWRAMSSPNLTAPEWMRTAQAASLGLAAVLGVAAIVVAVVGANLDFDAGSVCAVIGAVAAGSFIVPSAVIEVWWRYEYADYVRGLRDEDAYPETVVPEREAMRDRERRTMLRRLEVQRAARSQRAASGGSVSSTEAGRPSQGSSDAMTEP